MTTKVEYRIFQAFFRNGFSKPQPTDLTEGNKEYSFYEVGKDTPFKEFFSKATKDYLEATKYLAPNDVLNSDRPVYGTFEDRVPEAEKIRDQYIQDHTPKPMTYLSFLNMMGADGWDLFSYDFYEEPDWSIGYNVLVDENDEILPSERQESVTRSMKKFGNHIFLFKRFS